MLRHESSLEEFEPDLRNALESVAKQLPAQDLRDVEEYLDYGEYGVAYELLIFLLDKQQLAWPVTLIRKADGSIDREASDALVAQLKANLGLN
ncbi:MafI family immunity protein [Cupriavidus gilardii]|uniref:MafI family immunity protein n=1 Tax=Cupriavidus gilardii TaxID=82541 RepID=UPI001572D7AE|nr:MafI family immunity protein [Cupriavidus gilardii]